MTPCLVSSSSSAWGDAPSDSGTTSAVALVFDPSDPDFASVGVRGTYASSLASPPFGGCLLPAPDPSDTQVHSVTIDLSSQVLASYEEVFWFCDPRGSSASQGRTVGWATLPRTYTVTRSAAGGALEATHCLVLSATLRKSSGAVCGSGPVPTNFRWALYYNNVRTVGGGSPQSLGSNSAGLIAIDELGTISRHGVFADSVFDPYVDPGTGDTIIDNSSSPWTESVVLLDDSDFASPSDTMQTVTDDPQWDGFLAGVSADIDRDGAVCWTDRLLFVGTLNSSIGDVNYSPRADMDLDGDVNNADYASYVALFDSQVACKADVNCSGGISPQDIYDFLAYYYSGTLTGDFNSSGAVSPQDIYDFLAAYYLPC